MSVLDLSEIHVQVCDRLFEGESPEQISEKLHVDVEWVKEIETDMLYLWNNEMNAAASYDNDAASFGAK